MLSSSAQSGAWKASNRAAYTGDEAISPPGKTHQSQRCGVGRGFRQSQRGKENFLPTKECTSCPAIPHLLELWPSQRPR